MQVHDCSCIFLTSHAKFIIIAAVDLGFLILWSILHNRQWWRAMFSSVSVTCKTYFITFAVNEIRNPLTLYRN